MPADAVTRARLRAYELMEQAQSESHQGVRERLVELEATCTERAFPETAQLAATGVVLYDLVHGDDRQAVAFEVEDLINRATGLDAPPLIAAALGLRAILGGIAHDSPALLGDAGRAAALVESDELPALDRCFVWVLCAGAYNTLGLWELADELYDRAAEHGPLCEQPIQQAAVVVNRFLIRLEWTAALLELGMQDDALEQVRRASLAVRDALRTRGLPRPWRLGASACRHLLDFVKAAFMEPGPEGADVDERLERLGSFRAQLAEAGDVEVLPFLEGFAAVALIRLGRRDDAASWLSDTTDSTSSGARSFRAWVRAEALTPAEPDAALTASRDYGTLVTRMRWNARNGVLTAARSKIVEEKLTAEHAILAREVMLDPMTGLENRRAFDHWLASAPTQARPTALLLIDLDAFKGVNDRYGHAVGDDVLRGVAGVLAQHVRQGDKALRLGGDEFAVLLNGSPGADEAKLRRVAFARSRAIRAAVAHRDWDEITPGLSPTISIGVASGMLGPPRTETAEEIYRRADRDLYIAKSRRAVPDVP